MSTGDSKGDKYRTCPIFPHNDQKTSRAERWRDFDTNLQSYIGTKTPILAEHILSDIFDEDELNCGQSDDFFHYTLGITSTTSEKTLKAAQEKYLQAQYELFSCLTTNFQTTNRATIDRYKKKQVVERIMKQNPSVTPNDLWVRFVPFASLCYLELASKYDDQGATDALIKLHNFQIAKPFKPNNVSTWISGVENTWSQVADIADDPAYLAALELLLSVKNSKHEIWSPWASNFAHEHRDKAFVVDELLSQVRAKNNLEQASSSTSQVQATVSYASDQGNNPSPKINSGDKRRKVCAWNGCKRKTRYTYCQSHYRKIKPNDHSGVSPAARAKISDSSLEKAKRTMLKSQERYKALRDAKKSVNAEAHSAEANTAALEAATEYEHDESVPDESEHVFVSRKRKRASATSAAKPAKPKKKKLLGKLKVITDSQATAKKKKKKKTRSTAEALVACSDNFFDNMVITQFDRN